MVLRMGTFIPFEVSYYLNGHNFIERQLLAAGVGFRKDVNAIVAVADPAALQAAADRFTPEVIQPRLNYWTVAVGPKFSKRDRLNAKTRTQLFRTPGGVLSELRLQTESPDPHDLRAQ
jgi:hypothetical protein